MNGAAHDGERGGRDGERPASRRTGPSCHVPTRSATVNRTTSGPPTRAHRRPRRGRAVAEGRLHVPVAPRRRRASAPTGEQLSPGRRRGGAYGEGHEGRRRRTTGRAATTPRGRRALPRSGRATTRGGAAARGATRRPTAWRGRSREDEHEGPKVAVVGEQTPQRRGCQPRGDDACGPLQEGATQPDAARQVGAVHSRTAAVDRHRPEAGPDPVAPAQVRPTSVTAVVRGDASRAAELRKARSRRRRQITMKSAMTPATQYGVRRPATSRRVAQPPRAP